MAGGSFQQVGALSFMGPWPEHSFIHSANMIERLLLLCIVLGAEHTAWRRQASCPWRAYILMGQSDHKHLNK